MKIVHLKERMDLVDRAIDIFWEQWGNEDNFKLYEDCIHQSLKNEDELPLFYTLLDEEKIIGTYALLRNDMNSRQDLCPWLACLYVHPDHRGQQAGKQLLSHAVEEAGRLGYHFIYLATDLEGYYEKYGWDQEGKAFSLSGESINVYIKAT
ncbi:GNAT family N-acetyltransferase [Halobacillus sp. Nhm2S1]|uniref:GNAT family N-acetyltransferase n=1 Tax=Halobacillus sp. Nhm2S1 TaxID=2866716 RepID=UPI001C73C601|nr:GNAT family N-acetyltransferase [Halobacillus sp. Nhm2S1]MBX0359726.1 GNAT family N-acetyltransferase [Halobacillus sp. Nhm2S1]